MILSDFLKYINNNNIYSYKELLYIINIICDNYNFIGKTNKIFIVINNKKILLLMRQAQYHGQWYFVDLKNKYLKYKLNDYIKHIYRIENNKFNDKHFNKNGHTKKITNYYKNYIYNKKRIYDDLLNTLIQKDKEFINNIKWL